MDNDAHASHTDGRIPPQDLEAEKSLLGAILLSDSNFPNVLEIVKARDFYDPRHTDIFSGMTNLFNLHRPIDLMTLTSELKSNGKLKTIGGAPYLTELTNFVPTASHAEAYAELVSQAAIRRRLISAGTDIANAAYDGSKQITDLVGQAEKTLYDVSDQTLSLIHI